MIFEQSRNVLGTAGSITKPLTADQVRGAFGLVLGGTKLATHLAGYG